ncbi:M24 family metallopeptidase [Thalassotalea sp. Y01]|uniref:M24 family metallopeptidase n=1 Tax=Thalassotalea sp. Y01 TaxID=2729613 RepID=UPI00145DB665|nr:aminopeptidase P family protein [Thalassotalea sp. Y01]
MLLYVKKLLSVVALLTLSFISIAQQSDDLVKKFNILPLQQRAEVVDQILQKRVETLLPQLMRRSNIDMWVLISREYNEDPVIETMLPGDWFGARRRTILVFTDLGKEQGVRAEAISTYDVSGVFKKAWDKTAEPNQMQALVKLIDRYQPNRIGINVSDTYGLADGLAASDKQLLQRHLPANLSQRLVSAEELAVSWLDTRIDEEVEMHRNLVGLTKAIIHEGFSTKVIRPRKTTIGDLVWWFRERVNGLGLDTWFQPAIRLQRKYKKMGVSQNPDEIIMPGDLLHVDFGIHYLRLNSDIQQHAYVLKAQEKTAPRYLKQALGEGNKLQDLLLKQFKPGRSGNEILSRAREQALLAGLRPMIYTHPIGYHGHGAGTTIGKWDSQHGVAGDGDRKLYPDAAYSIELNVTTFVKEWQKDVMIMLEENAFYNGDKVEYLVPRQNNLILINYK